MRITNHNSRKPVHNLLIVADREGIRDLIERLQLLELRNEAASDQERVDIHDHWEEEQQAWEVEKSQVTGLKSRFGEPPFILIGLVDSSGP